MRVPEHRPLQFGIPSLDELLGTSRVDPKTRVKSRLERFGLHAPMGGTTMSIIGPNGTGKSALAMHLASRYAADCLPYFPRIIYISTDLSHEQAATTWSAFGLNFPNVRH